MDLLEFALPIFTIIDKYSDEEIISGISKIYNTTNADEIYFGADITLRSAEDYEFFMMACLMVNDEQIENKYSDSQDALIIKSLSHVKICRTIYGLNLESAIAWLRDLVADSIDKKNYKLILLYCRIKMLDPDNKYNIQKIFSR